MPRYRGYDQNMVVHMAQWKGGPLATCQHANTVDDGAYDVEENPEPIRLGPLYLTPDTPLTCIACSIIETEEAGAKPDDGKG